MVLTGYNTDIDFDGTTFHVQTEDKGRENPYIESLVYARGEILYSKRTAYHDLVAQEVDAKAISSLMERQHRTLAEAIRRGRLAKLMGADAAALEGASDQDGAEAATILGTAEGAAGPSLDEVILEYLKAQRGKAHLILNSGGDQDFVYGATTEVRVVAVDSQDRAPQPGVQVSVLFKSTAEPRRLQLAGGETDANGVFAAPAALPEFNGGTSAVVVTAESDLGQSEIKHLVHR
ncbi:MAG: hypothetical protein K8R59_16540 [Thermoanaerobaculales bacterium]|nr:hypothetical protein [Thermoanaerobaculales bacterium]